VRGGLLWEPQIHSLHRTTELQVWQCYVCRWLWGHVSPPCIGRVPRVLTAVASCMCCFTHRRSSAKAGGEAGVVQHHTTNMQLQLG
jgi:hypothetical protein